MSRLKTFYALLEVREIKFTKSVLDVITRLNSTFDMLYAIVMFEQCSSIQPFKLTENEWHAWKKWLLVWKILSVRHFKQRKYCYIRMECCGM